MADLRNYLQNYKQTNATITDHTNMIAPQPHSGNFVQDTEGWQVVTWEVPPAGEDDQPRVRCTRLVGYYTGTTVASTYYVWFEKGRLYSGPSAWVLEVIPRDRAFRPEEWAEAAQEAYRAYQAKHVARRLAQANAKQPAAAAGAGVSFKGVPVVAQSGLPGGTMYGIGAASLTTGGK